MKGHYLLILLLFVAPSFLFSQTSIERDVVATGGGEAGTPEGSTISWTIGEPVVQTFSTGGLILNQGFQQGGTVVTSVDSPQATPLEIELFPNPAFEQITIRQGSSIHEFELQLLDSTGKLLRDHLFKDQSIELDISHLPAASYILLFTDKEGRYESYRFIKQ